MNRPVIEVPFSEFDDMFDKLTAAAAERPPIMDARAVEDVLLKFGDCVRDARVQRDVIAFDSLDQCNAARAAVGGNPKDVLPPECSSAE